MVDTTAEQAAEVNRGEHTRTGRHPIVARAARVAYGYARAPLLSLDPRQHRPDPPGPPLTAATQVKVTDWKWGSEESGSDERPPAPATTQSGIAAVALRITQMQEKEKLDRTSGGASEFLGGLGAQAAVVTPKDML